MVAMADRDGQFTFANHAFRVTLGYADTDLIGRHFSAVLSERNSPALLQEIGRRALDVQGWKGECLAVDRDGLAIPIFLSVGAVHDESDRVVGSFGIAQDIRARKEAEEALRRSEEHFRQLAESIHEVFFVLTPEPLTVVYISPMYEEIWGRPRQELYDRAAAWIESVHPEDRERVTGVFMQCLTGSRTAMDYRIVRLDGAVRFIYARSFPAYDAQGRVSRVVGIAEDVTTRREEEAKLRKAYVLLDQALREAEQQASDSAQLAEFMDTLQSCRTVDEAYAITGRILPTILTAPSGALCLTTPSKNLVEVVASWGDRLATERAFARDDCWALRRGTIHIVSEDDSPLRCPHISSPTLDGHVCVPLVAQGETLGVLHFECAPAVINLAAGGTPEGRAKRLGQRGAAVGERISLALANLRLRDVLRDQSIRDPLTGLFNFRYMEESLERELHRAARTSQPVTLLMIDIDHFKRFNDTFGHQAGDTLLRALGAFLRQGTRADDVACRYGGEEFALILSHANAEAAATRGQLLREGLTHLAVQHAGQVLGSVTVSIGVATFPDHGESAGALIKAADDALYRAKREGRDRLIVAG
jgi:diguanylate cyclase (GGDEF)-like protein/PAS domain S-box-containing protein